MGVGDTNTLPSRSYPGIIGHMAPGMPQRVAGGIAGPEDLPSRALVHYPEQAGGILRGGIAGTRNYFRPSVDKYAPYIIGNTNINGPSRRAIRWWRGAFANTAGQTQFQPQDQAKPDWTSNRRPQANLKPGDPIPFSTKRFNSGGYVRGFNVDSQLYVQLPKWKVQRPFRLRQTSAQPQQGSPYQPKLTQFQRSAAYGQTTKLLQRTLTNTLPDADTGGGVYGSY